MAYDVSLTPRAELSEPDLGVPVAVSVGPGGEAVLLAVGEADAAGVLGRDGGFPYSRAPRPIAARVLVHDGRAVRRITIPDLPLAHPLVQPLPGGEILVVGGRCRRFDDGAAERNAHFYGSDGLLRRTATFGDGISDVQATTGGAVWVSYHDEGVFGNNGWGLGEASAPVGESGLVRFDSRGTKVWEFGPPDGFGGIADCYALNVGDGVTWIYYYTDFPLVGVGRDDTVRARRTGVSGARALALDARRVLFFGGYPPHRGRCLLGEVRDGAVAVLAEGRLLLPSGTPIEADRVIGRGPHLHAFVGARWYSVDIRHLP